MTETTGSYTLPKLPPVTFTVSATLAGLGEARANAIVVVDKDTTLNLSLTPAVSETVTVTAARPAAASSIR